MEPIAITEIITEKSTMNYLAVNTPKWGVIRLVADKEGVEVYWSDSPTERFNTKFTPMETKETLEILALSV